MMVHAPVRRAAPSRSWPQFQATEIDDWRDAEPGKIPHEMRFGELAHFNKIPHTPVLRHRRRHAALPDRAARGLEVARRRTTLLERYRETAVRCLDWIDRYGDLDGDGFQEYRTPLARRATRTWAGRTPATRWSTRTAAQVKQPKALCELQGYVYDAWMRMAEVFDALGEPERAAELRRKAAELRAALRRARSGARTSASTRSGSIPTSGRSAPSPRTPATASGAASPSPDQRRAGRAAVLSSPTCGAAGASARSRRSNPAYNPLSYQRGSVWPHDNGIIAAGLQALRLRRRGGARGARHLRGGQLLRGLPAARALRRASSASPARSRCSTSARTCPRPGPPAASSSCCRRSSACGPTRPTAGCTSTRRCRAGCRT